MFVDLIFSPNVQVKMKNYFKIEISIKKSDQYECGCVHMAESEFLRTEKHQFQRAMRQMQVQ